MYSSVKLNVVQKTTSNSFSGSGTVLLGALERDLDVIACEVNPAAYAMSKSFEIGAFAIPEKRGNCS